MATLRTTTKGGLSKYTSGVLDVVGTAMSKRSALKVGSKLYTPANNKKNADTLKKYAQLAASSTTEAEAKNLLLETSNGDTFAIGNLEKPKESGNKGDVAEGIIGAAMTARFLHKNTDITKVHVQEVLIALGSGISKIKTKDFQSPNKNSKIVDDVNFYLSLAESNMKFLLDKKNWATIDDLFNSAVKYANGATVVAWSKLLYENNQKNKIEIISDGLGNQSGTKVDVRIKVDGKPTNVNLSLKAGDVKQFGQVSGSGFEKQITLWKQLIGFDVSKLEKQYTQLVAKKQINDAIYLTYEAAAKEINSKLKDSKSKTKFLKTLGEGIQYYATLNEENVTLVQMTGNEAKIYNFDKVYDSIKNIPLNAIIKDSAGKPKLVIQNDKGKSLLEVRVKAEGRPDGTAYIRNYIEKGEVLGDAIATYA